MAAATPIVQAGLKAAALALATQAAANAGTQLSGMSAQQIFGLAKSRLTQRQKRQIAAAPRNRRAAVLKSALAANDALPNKPGKRAVTRDAQFRSNPTNRLQVAPSGQGYYDAFVNVPTTAVTAMSVGLATGVNGRLRFTVEGHPRTNMGSRGLAVIPNLQSVLLTSVQDALNEMKATYPNGMFPVYALAEELGLPAPKGSMMSYLSVDDSLAEIATATQNQLLNYPADGGNVGLVTDTSRLLLFQNFPNNSIGCMIYDVLGVPGNSVSIHEHAQDIPQFADTANDEGIPVRMSIRIRNVTEALAVGGTVRVLRLATGIALPTNANDYWALRDLIRSSVHTVTYSGHELCKMSQINAYVGDQVRSTTFTPNAGGSSSTGEDFFRTSVRAPALTTVCILIDDFASSGGAVNNTYEITGAYQRLVRFTPGSTLHSMAQQVGTKPPEQINEHRDATERQGSMLQTVGHAAQFAFGGMSAAAGIAQSMFGKF